MREPSSSHCSLAETSLEDRIEKQLEQNNERHRGVNRTAENLGKLQQITDDVKFLTKQLQLSIGSNRNNHAVSSPILGTERSSLIVAFLPLQMNAYSGRSAINWNVEFSC